MEEDEVVKAVHCQGAAGQLCRIDDVVSFVKFLT